MHDHDFSKFDNPKEFEFFVQELLFELLGSNFISSASSGKDGGIDGFFSGKLLEKEGKFIFQVKYSADYTGIWQQRSTVKRLILNEIKTHADIYHEKSDVVVFITNTLLTTPQKLEIKEFGENEYGLAALVWDQAELQFLLSRTPFTREKYFPTIIPPISRIKPSIYDKPDIIIERTELIRKIESFLSSSETFLQLYGPRGAGKSFLVYQIVDKHSEKYALYRVYDEADNLSQFTKFLDPSKTQVFLLETPSYAFVDSFKKILYRARLKLGYKCIVTTRKVLTNLRSINIEVPNLTQEEANRYFERLKITDEREKRKFWQLSNGNFRELKFSISKMDRDLPSEYTDRLNDLSKLSNNQRKLVLIATLLGPLKSNNLATQRIYNIFGFSTLDDVYQVYDELEDSNFLSVDRSIIDTVTPRLKSELIRWILTNRPQFLMEKDLINAVLIKHQNLFSNLSKFIQFTLGQEKIHEDLRSWLEWLFEMLSNEKLNDLYFITSLDKISFYFPSIILSFIREVYTRHKALFDHESGIYGSINIEQLVRGLRPIFYHISFFRSAFNIFWDIFIDHSSNSLVNQYMYELLRFEVKRPFEYQRLAFQSIIKENERKTDTDGKIVEHLAKIFSLEFEDYERVFSTDYVLRISRGEIGLSEDVIGVLNESFNTLKELFQKSRVLNKPFLESLDQILVHLDHHIQKMPKSEIIGRKELLELMQQAISLTNEIIPRLQLENIDEIIRTHNRVKQLSIKYPLSLDIDDSLIHEEIQEIPLQETISIYNYEICAKSKILLF